MAFLRDVKDRMWEYISPRKTQQRREKPFKVPALPSPTPRAGAKRTPHSSPDSMKTPDNVKISRWQYDLTTPTSSMSMDAALLPPSPPTSIERHLEGETLFHSDVQYDSPMGSVEADVNDDWDANESTELLDDGRYVEKRRASDSEKEKLRREAQGRELREAGWSADAVFLFQKLGLRGFEPLMPESWKNDFNTLPFDLFTANDEIAFIKPDLGSEFHAQHALSQLFALGGHVRDAVLNEAPIRTPEYHVRRAVQSYDKWAMKDAGMKQTWENLSLFSVSISDKTTSSSDAEHKMIRKLAKLQDLWFEAFETHDSVNQSGSDFVAAPEELPTIYGVVASHTIMAFVSYVAPSEHNDNASLRTIAMFNFGEPGYDVWNALAIAIFVIHCRNRMKQLRDFLPVPTTVEQHDPDL